MNRLAADIRQVGLDRDTNNFLWVCDPVCPVPTHRDLTWFAVLQLMETKASFTVRDVHEASVNPQPSEKTVRSTLHAMVKLGLLQSEIRTGRNALIYYPIEPEPGNDKTGYTPQKGHQSSLFPYPGGKATHADWIVDRIPRHDTYIELFGGAAGVMFNKRSSKCELYNEIDGDLTQFFGVLRDKPSELADWLQGVPYAKMLYEEWRDKFYEGIRPAEPVERAGRYFSLRYMQISGALSPTGGFKTRARRSPARTFNNARERIDEVAKRLKEVQIENRDYREILDKYDDSKADVLFYADPPYIGSEQRYNQEFDHDEFTARLHDVENDWMVSYADIPSGLEDYHIEDRKNRHRMKQNQGNVREHLICNFDPDERESHEAYFEE